MDGKSKSMLTPKGSLTFRSSAAALVVAITTGPAAARAEPQLRLNAKPGGVIAKGTLGDGKVNVDFPEPTDIKDITRAVSLWTERPTVLDDSVRGKVVIHAPERVSMAKAQERYRAALDELGLAEVEHHGVTQILPAALANDAHLETQREAIEPPGLAEPAAPVMLDFTEPTAIADVARTVARWSGRRIVVDDDALGRRKVRLWTGGRTLPQAQAYQVYLTALDQLGLTEIDRGNAVHIIARVPLTAPPKDLQSEGKPIRLLQTLRSEREREVETSDTPTGERKGQEQ